MGFKSEPEPIVEDRQQTNISKSKLNSKTENEEKFEGVKFYELDDKEEILQTGNDPIPQITMPSFKKRVHSQRIPQHERTAVTPYEGTYDEKYSSDEENIEYDVCEPEDLTERSNSTVTFSEDIYDSDAIDELIKNQIRKPSQISSESVVETGTDVKPKSILKDGKSKGSPKDSQTSSPTEAKQTSSQSKKIISAEKISESAITKEGEKTPGEICGGENKKNIENEDKTIKKQTMTDKETLMKGEKEAVTQSLQSTIPLQLDQITDSSATNIHGFAKNGENLFENVTKPLQNIALKQQSSGHNEELSIQKKPTNDTPEEEKTDEYQRVLKEDKQSKKSEVSELTTELSDPRNIVENIFSSPTKSSKDIIKNTEDQKVEIADIPKNMTFTSKLEDGQSVLLTREEVTPAAVELIEEVTRTVQDVFPVLQNEEHKQMLNIELKQNDSLNKTGDVSLTESIQPLKSTEKSPVLDEDQKTGKETEFSLKDSSTKPLISLSQKDNQTQETNETNLKEPETHTNQKPTETITEAKRASLEEKIFSDTIQVKQTIEEGDNMTSDVKVETESDLTAVRDKVAKNLIDSNEKALESVKNANENFESKSSSACRTETEKDLQIVKDLSASITNNKQFVDTNDTISDKKVEDKLKTADILVLEGSDKTNIVSDVNILSQTDSESDKNIQSTFSKPTMAEQGSIKGEENTVTSESSKDLHLEEKENKETESKPRVIFRIDSEDELLSEAEILPRSDLASPVEEFTERVRKELKESLEKDQLKLEERLTSLKCGIFDISDESLSKTKELVDQRLRKISEIKPPLQESEETFKKEKSPARLEEKKIGRFHITPALVDEVISKSKELEIVEKLKTNRGGEDAKNEVEKELPEKLTEADLEEVIRELKKEGLKTDVYLQPENSEKEEKKERTLKRVERRFERMASETLEMGNEEGVSEDKLNEKRENEFQRMVSNLSSEEVAKYQQDYVQLWEEGGLSSLTPTEDWESRDPDTPENELDDDTSKETESFRGSQGNWENGESIKSTKPKKSLKSPVSPPKPPRMSDETVTKTQPLISKDVSSPVGSLAPSQISESASSERDDVLSYGERKKFWEQMSTSQSSGSLTQSMIESAVPEYQEIEKSKIEAEKLSVKAVKQTFETEISENQKDVTGPGLVKSLTESYSQKIAEGKLVMPAIPRLKSASKESSAHDTVNIETHKVPDSSDIAMVSELELKFQSKDSSAPITEETVIFGNTDFEKYSTKNILDTSSETTETLQIEKTSSLKSEDLQNIIPDEKSLAEEEVNLPLEPIHKLIEDSSSPLLVRKSIQERSMSLPISEIPNSVKMNKKYFEDEMKKEIITEQIMTKKLGKTSLKKEDVISEKKLTPEIEEAAASAMTEVLSKSVEIAEKTLQEKPIIEKSTEILTEISSKIPDILGLKESHEEKSETEGNEKEKAIKVPMSEKKEEESLPLITVTPTGKLQVEAGSVGESEDTQSESDITPEEGRTADNAETNWEGREAQSRDFSPKDDMDYSREIKEIGIGRWIGQEDLSKQNWDKDDLDSSHFKIATKWERTRSEGGSPKEHFVCTPEEHYPDTVWEVPVQEQLENEEITHDIPIEKQVIIEKDEEDYEEEELKTKLTEEEAKEIAEEILEYIQFEVENRSSFLINDDEEPCEAITQAQVTDYLRHLTGGKEFDDQDVQLIESILAKKQKQQLWKSQSAETTDITDEELRSANVENYISPVESQITKPETFNKEYFYKVGQKLEGEQDLSSAKEPDSAQTLTEAKIVDQTIAEVKESLEAAQEQLIEQHKYSRKSEPLKKESPSEFEFKGYEKRTATVINEQSEWETTKQLDIEVMQELKITDDSEVETTEKTPKKQILDKEVDETDIKPSNKLEKPETLKQTEEKTKEFINLSAKDAKAEIDTAFFKPDEVSQQKAQKDTKIPKSSITDTITDKTFKGLEINVPETKITRKLEDLILSSEDSPKSTSLEEPMKSPPGGEDILSSGSSFEKHGDNKSDIVLRHSSSTHLKSDRRSGADLEPYSSSGESHYHSFEQTSRPCSSDVEGLLGSNVGTAGSSEYESAISQELSSKQPTSTDYHTAVSSLSSRESIKSLDSESSGHLASVEVSSEASETLIPSALELDKDLDAPTLLEDDASDFMRERRDERPAKYKTQISTTTVSKSGDEDFEIISESEIGASEDDENAGEEDISGEENCQKMKRSQEMTFQPEPKPIVLSESLDGFSKDGLIEKNLGISVDENSSITSAIDEKFGSSLEESGSVLSMSLSTASETSAMRTVIELSHTDSEKMDGSLTISGTSVDSASREDIVLPGSPKPQSLTHEMSTSTSISGLKKKTESVTITTSSSDVQGVPCASTQVTSVSRKSSMVDEAKSEGESYDSQKPIDLTHANGPTQVDYNAEYDEAENSKTKKSQGHRRKESTSNFVPTMLWNVTEGKTQKGRAHIVDTQDDSSDKYVHDVTLTEKEVKNDEKKEADDLEDFEDQEMKVLEGENEDKFKTYDSNRLLSQTSKTDSDDGQRPASSIFGEDQTESELSQLIKQNSSETEREDPLERPLSPEPEEMENKDITPEFSSEAQASVTELEMEYSGAYSRRDEYASHVSPIREEKTTTKFSDTGDQSLLKKVPDGLQSQTSLESTIAEKHELESGEKEILQKKVTETIVPDVPDIKVTEHKILDAVNETSERERTSKISDEAAPTTTKTSPLADLEKDYEVIETKIKKTSKKVLKEEKDTDGIKDEKESLSSPSSDSFEMLDKPDIADEFVIIEEVGREAQENDQEGKSIQITSQKKKSSKRIKEEQEVILSPPGPATKMTELKYYPSEEDSDLFSFESDSPPRPSTRKFADKLRKKPGKEEKDEVEYEQQLEQNKKWLETQFQGEQAAKIMGVYGYEMEFERAPLEDIKEEDLNELDSSSKIGSMGSQKESLGSFGSVKDSFSSTPDYDVLAGRKYFTKSGDQDDVSMSSLQEFELIEKKLMENGKKSGSSSSQDSLSSKKLGTSSKSGQGDDISTASLREFETLENAVATELNMEKKAKQEEAILTEIDEGHESQISESESCETVSAVVREKIELDHEDFDKKMFEIDEIIRQAQSNVEKFSEIQALEKIESIGRGDSYEEVAKVPDLELDMPLSGKPIESTSLKQNRGNASYYTQVVTKKKVEEWRAAEKTEQQKMYADKAVKQKTETPKDSELLENGGKIKSISVDSLKIASEKQCIPEEKEDTISLDSYRRKFPKTNGYGFSEIKHKSDSMEEVSTSLKHHESSSGDYTFSGTDHRQPRRADFVLGSTDSLDPSSSTATHATYQYETDSVMSSSFTSGDSNTMVSSTDNLDLLVSGQSVIDLSKDLGLSRTDDWLENLQIGSENPLEKELADGSEKHLVQKVLFEGPNAQRALEEYLQTIPKENITETEEIDEHGNVHIKKILKQSVVIRKDGYPKATKSKVESDSEEHAFVSETVEPIQNDSYSHIIHKKVQGAPEIQKVVFKGPDAKEALTKYIDELKTNEESEETVIDEHGNIHIKKVIRQRVVVQPEIVQRTSAELNLHSDNSLEIRASAKTKEELEDENSHLTGPLKKNNPREEDYQLKISGESLQEDGSSHRKEINQPTEIKKITFKGPDAEKQLQEYLKQQQPEVEEIEEVDEHGNIHMKKVLKQRIVIRPSKELTQEELEQCLSGLHGPESYVASQSSEIPMSSQVQKITFKGPDAEKQLQEYLKQQQPEVEEIEEVDEHGNIHIKKVLKQRIVIRPSKELTQEELEQCLSGLHGPESYVASQSSEIPMSSQVQKITFKGPDAEKQLQEYLKQQQPEVEEIEEVDEHGNIHIKKVLKQRIVIRPSKELTKDELEQYLGNLEEPEFKGILSQKKLSDLEEENIHRDTQETRTLDLSQRLLTEEEFQERLKQRLSEPNTIHTENVSFKFAKPSVSETVEPLDEEGFSHMIHQKIEMVPQVQKVVFKGPQADEALQAYIETLNPGENIEEVEEVDEHGNVHIKKIIHRKFVLKPENLGKTSLTSEELQSFLKQHEINMFEGGETSHVHYPDPTSSSSYLLPEGFSSSLVLTEKEDREEGKKSETETSSAVRKESGVSQRPPLVSDISMDDEAEYDTTEHDWRHQLEILHAEADEEEIDQNLDTALATSYSSPKEK